MTNKFVTADLHFDHRGIVKFINKDGTKVRPWDDVEEMNKALVINWNETVNPEDTVFVLGDFCINRSGLRFVDQLNGKKILIKGNHDNFRIEEYSGFAEIHSCVVLNGMILTHIPVHESQLERFGLNVHGHLHNNVVMKGDKYDPRYMCVSVELTGYKPIGLNVCREVRDDVFGRDFKTKGNN